MKKTFSLLSFSAIVAAATLFSFPALSNAQVGLSLYPIKFDVTLDPGQTYTNTVTVINPNSFAIGIQPQVENLAGGDQGQIALENTDIPHGLSSWITMDLTPFTLQGGEQKQVQFTITVPADGQPGGNYGAILFEGAPANGTSSASGVGISGRVGSVILVNVPGVGDATGNVTSFGASSSYYSHGPANFTFTIQDTGNTYYTPSSTVTLSGPFFPKQTLQLTSGVVFPGYGRTYTATWSGHYAFGPLTATLVTSIPDSGTITKTVTIWVFPWQEGLIVLVIILILVLIFRVFGKRFKIVRVKE
jgi:hypothetical protein